MNAKNYVLYHAHCPDGFGAATIAWMYYGAHSEYVPVSYGKPIPVEIPDGSTVYILDFSYPRAVLDPLAARCRLIVLDHHATAEVELRDAPYAHFDKTKSGAMLAWEHFYPRTAAGYFVLYLQDRDLWQWKLPHSREVSAAVASYPFEFDRWRHWMVDNELVGGLAVQGESILRLIRQQVERQARAAGWVTLGGHPDIPCVNATAFVSETGEKLLELHPAALFVAVYIDGAERRTWSLRSRKDFDCSVVAKGYGGGGHKQACGFHSELTFRGEV